MGDTAMIHFILSILAILSGIAFYVKGETDTKLLGKCNKAWKYATGLFIAPIFALMFQSWIPLLCWATYPIATSFGYGENNWLTKLIGQKNAICLVGVLLGLASFPVIGFWAILQGVISGYVWYYIWKKDGIINEPWVAIGRSASSLCLLLF
jgi:hypothetical protein